MQQAVRRPDASNQPAWPRQDSNGGDHHHHHQQHPPQESPSKKRASLELDKKGAASKTKDLSHVPCKFHKQGSCQAGPSCPFSHDLTVPGTTKPICQWYAKGNCKFGHKCALAHILPGQPMSFDRKNKRAAQAALREAQNAGHEQAGGGQHQTTSPPRAAGVSAPPSEGSPPAPRNAPANGSANGSGSGSGIARSLKNSLDMGRPLAAPPVHNAWNVAPGGGGGSATATTTTTNGSTTNGTDLTTASHNPVATFIPPPSGLSQGLLSQQLGTNGGAHAGAGEGGVRSSVAAQMMLSQQGRRLSNKSNSHSLSPTRLPHQSRRADAFGSSPPLAVPVPSTNGGAGGAGGGTASIFGTSPFSGSKSLFMPSSYDSSDDALGRSPPGRVAAEQMRRTSSSAWDNQHANFFGHTTDEDALADDQDDDEYEEGFLPSSLNELLTPEEQRRRATRMGSHFDPFQNSRSVPAEFTLARGRPGMPSASNWGESSTMTVRASASRSPHISPPPPSSRSFLAVGSPPRPDDGNSLQAHFLGRNDDQHFNGSGASGFYSASFDPSTAFGGRYQQQTTFPDGLRGQALPAPGSLPGGLAAGLSQLHLIPANHTGDTPPVGSPFGNTAPPSTASLSPPGTKSVWNGAPMSWGSSTSADHMPPSPQGFTLAATGTNGNVSTLKLPSVIPRRLSGNAGQYPMSQGSSPLHQAVGPAGYEDDIQFDMD